MLEKAQDTRKAWTIQEDKAIISIVQEVGIKNWSLISQLMKDRYFLFGRSGKQCRQRWQNQLNPTLNKLSWTEQQQQRLFQAHKKFGNKWIQISKQFQGRTDNNIKNHFYSTIRRSMRRICKILGNRNSTSKLRIIKPSILSEIFEFSKTQQFKLQNSLSVVDIASCLLQYAKLKPKKSQQFDPDSKDDLENLIKKLVILNEQYVNQKMKSNISKSSTNKFSRSKISRQSKNFRKSKQQHLQTHQSITYNENINFQKMFQKNSSLTVDKSHCISLKTAQRQIYDQQQADQCSFEHPLDLLDLGNEEVQNQGLVIKQMKMQSFQMLCSNKCLNENENLCFQNLKNPSICEISSYIDSFLK